MSKYNVYQIFPKCYYSGFGLVSATSIEEANEYIDEFKKSDQNNEFDSYGYEKVEESDVIKNVYSDRKGIINYGIFYIG